MKQTEGKAFWEREQQMQKTILDMLIVWQGAEWGLQQREGEDRKMRKDQMN